MRPIKHFILHPKDILIGIMTHTASLWPDKAYLRIVYFLRMGKVLHLNKPVSFTEKINWLKVNNKHPEYSQLVDKYEVKKYVEEKLGSDENIIKTIGVWDSFDDIDFSKLPNQFVLKTTNGGGNTSVVICRDKTQFNINSARKKLQLVDSDAYNWSREYTYQNIKPRIIAEEFISTPDNELSDYKFFCFDGVPKFLFVGTERQKEGCEVKFDFFDTEFNHLPVKNGHENSSSKLVKPKNFDKMLTIASKLSKGIKQVRVDLYNVDGNIYFGEMTFFHFGGFIPFEPDEWDYKFGEYFTIDCK